MAGHDKVTAQGKRFLKELQKLSEKQVRVGLKRGKKGKRHNGTSSQTDLVDIALYNAWHKHYTRPPIFCADGTGT